MAESKFLRYQDKNGDGLVDVCEDIIEVKEGVVCPECIPDPNAVMPDWRTGNQKEPWLNGKNCKFQIVIIASDYSSLLPAGTEDLTEEEAAEYVELSFERYQEEAIKNLLLGFNKKVIEASKEAIRGAIEHTKYYLDVRAASKVRLLYSVPYEDFASLEDDNNTEDEKPSPIEQPLVDAGAKTITYLADDLYPFLTFVRKGLKLYSMYYKVYQAIEGGNLVFANSRKVFTTDQLSNYGKRTGSMGTILLDLDNFLNSKGVNIVGAGQAGLFKDRVKKIIIKFDSRYKVKKLTVYTENCGEVPLVYEGDKLSTLTSKESFKDSTAMAYFANLHEMHRDLDARTPGPWIDFIKKYTYPEVVEEINYGIQETNADCIAKNLAEEGKQLGQDILDPVFGLKDAIAYQFHKNMCKKSLGEAQEEWKKLGLVYDPESKSTKNILVFAQEQAYKQMEASGNPFEELCVLLLGSALSSKFGMSQQLTDDIFSKGLDRLKLCGLYELLMDCINCLMKGLTLEESLSRILKSALGAMSIENFGDLFVGLPAEKQAELDALVKKKLASGDLFKNDSQNQELSDTIAGKINVIRPWEQPANIDEQRETKKESYVGMTAQELKGSSERSRKTLAQQLDLTDPTRQLNPNVVFQAYVLALIEVYADDYFGLLDMLNKYPGAQLIASFIALMDCPRPPVLDPSVTDAVKDLELPFCDNIFDISMPQVQNPFGWIPKVMDWTGLLFLAARQAIQQAIIQVIIKLMVKICSILGGSLCDLLARGGDMNDTLPPSLGEACEATFKDMIKDSICGPDADIDQINTTIVSLFSNLGVGATALANQDQVIKFAEDLSCAVTPRELIEAFQGNCSNEFLTVVDSLIQFEYPDFREGLSNKNSICSFFGDTGNLFPAEVKDNMQNFLDALPADEMVPANPSLCAAPDAFENFCELRAGLLEGRASPEQALQMCEDIREDLQDDLEDIADLLNKNPLDDALPPIVSDPGCDNGIFPFEPEEATNTATQTLSNGFEQLKIDFSEDMLGNGPGERRWGLINMILSDTQGNPYTAHTRKSFFQRRYVDFVTDMDKGSPWKKDEYGKHAAVWKQVGQFPKYVANHMKNQMEDVAVSFDSNNLYLPTDRSVTKSFEDLGFDTWFGPPDVNLTELPELGYNIIPQVKNNAEEVVFVELGRKEKPDMSLSFQDLYAGREMVVESSSTGITWGKTWGYGFEIGMYTNDLHDLNALKVGEDEIPANRLDGNARIVITDKFNLAVKEIDPDIEALMTKDQLEEYGASSDGDAILEEQKYEFLAIDDVFERLDFSEYPNFLRTSEEKVSYTPPVYLLQEILKKNGSAYSLDSIKTAYDSAITTITSDMIQQIAANEGAFAYGVVFDDLTASAFDYVLASETTTEDGTVISPAGTLYAEAKVEAADGGTRKIRRKDQIMGVSQDQYDNGEDARVIYLNPGQFGGSYLSPPLYVKPLKNKGWVALVEALFPEMSQCRPRLSDLVDFEDIDDAIQSKYQSIPEDERLKGDPDCIQEIPYSRILSRPAKAGIEGLIIAALRIYACTHFVKSLATFTWLKPSAENYSSIFSQYIIENMEEDFKEPSTGLAALSPFKDSEFWYGFLEQGVQLYSRLIDEGEIEPPQYIWDALDRLGKVQEAYEYPYRDDLRDAKAAREVGRLKLLKNYRMENNLEAVQETEEDAKLILNELMKKQLDYVGEKIVANLKSIGMVPEYSDLVYYMLSQHTYGATTLDLSGDYMETGTGDGMEIGATGEYTSGNTFTVHEVRGEDDLKKGDPYVGYYHVHEDDDGNPVYMTGEEHVEDEHSILKPFASKTKIISAATGNDLGDISEYGTRSVVSTYPFIIEKYISINGAKMAPTDAIDKIKTNPSGDNISDWYPGTLARVFDANGAVVGLEGQLGVRYGLEFSVVVDGEKAHLTTVEIDALDTSIDDMAPLEGSSKLLLCLIENLKKDNIFQIAVDYIFALNKSSAFIAIYNDLAFLPSIGEITVPYGVSEGKDSDFLEKPGMKVKIEITDGVPSVDTSDSKYGWASYKERQPGRLGGLFVNEWDSWDKELLRNSKKRIKRMFKDYYNSRKWRPGDRDRDGKVSDLFVRNLRSSFGPKPGIKLVPWWKRRKFRINPFNAEGAMCKKKD